MTVTMMMMHDMMHDTVYYSYIVMGVLNRKKIR